MWQAIEAEMEKEREQAEALALIERRKAEMRARAQPPAAGIMQNALATLDSPTEGDEYNERFKPEVSEIHEILVDENLEQEEIDDSDVLLAPDLIEVRQDEGSNDSEITDELLEAEPFKEIEEDNEVTNDREEETVADDLAETESDETNSDEPEPEGQEGVDWDNTPDEEDGWAVGW